MLSLAEGRELVKLAKDAVSSHFSGEEMRISKEIQRKFAEKRGVFVTLTKDKELRGCIGFIEPYFPLWDSVVKAAQSAAFADPRFIPLGKDELKDVKFEISVLTEPELIEVKKPEEYIKKIKIGKDGLIIRGLYGSGLLLPQVAIEWKWDVKEFLRNTCLKAGLQPDDWKNLNNKIYKFQAQIFSEENGEIVEKKG
jgi:hypothetical protein